MRFLYLLVILLSLLSCSQPKQETNYLQIRGNAQGTTFNIIYNDSLHADYSKDIERILVDFDDELSTYLPTSWISGFNSPVQNQYSLGKTQYVTSCLSKAIYWKAQTKGYFDFAIKNIIDYTKQNPSLPKLDSVLAINKKVVLDSNALTKLDARLMLDFNALAQGYSVDVLSDFFDSKGIENYFVEIGGEVRTKGVNKKGEKWSIGLESPASTVSNRDYQLILNVSNKSVATSGSYRKFKEVDGVKYSHAINPFTGIGVQHNLLSVTVVANLCIDADALATAFLVMGEEKTRALIEKNNWDVEVYFIKANSNGYETSYTNGFQQYITI